MPKKAPTAKKETKSKVKKTTRKTASKTATKAKVKSNVSNKVRKGPSRKAMQILRDVSPENCFWVNNGWIIRNLQELPIALRNMDDGVFLYHVNDSKNDFHNWVRDVVGDNVLARSILRSNREKMIGKIEKRITQFK